MAKESGIGDLLFIAGVDLSGDVGAVQTISRRFGTFDMTAINQAGYDRIYGLIDGEISFNCYFNDAAAQQHLTLRTKQALADVGVAYYHGSGIGEAAAASIAKQINYDWTRGQDGALIGTVQMIANAKGLDYCEQLTAGKRTESTATNGASWNNGASSATGLVAYIQVFALTSGTPTVKIQESSNDGAGDAFADVSGATFGVVTNGLSTRVVTSLTLAVEQYLRVVTTGTFSGLTFAVCASRSPYLA